LQRPAGPPVGGITWADLFANGWCRRRANAVWIAVSAFSSWRGGIMKC